ncbi:MAG: HlyD family efflux transporter periplasmic adaptor subunit [Gammaproteobacteria bacterium]|nr:HlyD family efflux transporter periplasmic adaptor subunit [Gammaproteobacteria bacterium]MYD79369.1 HlyD family efflux transporter periplasmic adaptor subunit [Gammaproteobacteria bacterium]
MKTINYIRSAREGSIVLGLSAVTASLLLSVPALAANWYGVVKEDRVVTVTATGSVESKSEHNIGVPPSDSWRLRLDWLVEEGTRVNKGQRIFSIESSSQQRDLDELQGRLQVMESQVEAQKEKNLQDIESEKLSRANLESESIKATRKANVPAGTIPGIEYKKLIEQERLANTLYQRALTRQSMSERSRELQKAALDREIKRVEGNLEQRKKEMASFTVRAPINGLAIIGTNWEGQKLESGSRVGPGWPVVTVVDDKNILVRGTVHEQWAAKLAVGQRAIVETDALVGSKLMGTVASVGNTVRRKSQRSPTMVLDFTVEFDEDYSHVLDLNMNVHVTIEVDTLVDAIAVPKDALVYREGRPGVITKQAWTPVELGSSASEGYFIVLDGLEVGQKVKLL